MASILVEALAVLFKPYNQVLDQAFVRFAHFQHVILRLLEYNRVVTNMYGLHDVKK
jgi:hypothetical protein